MVGINSNLAAASAQRNLSAANNVVQDSIARLSSGNRIIKASDDVAGLAIGTSIKSTVTSLEIALLNSDQARAVLQIADGALQQVGDILTRQKALSSQATSGSISDNERGFLNQEFAALTSEIDRIVTNTNFNGITLLNGSIAGDAGVTVASPAATTTNTAAVSATLGATAPGAGDYNFTTSVLLETAGVIEAGDIDIDLSSFDDPTAQGSLSGATVTGIFFNENGASAESAQFQLVLNGVTYNSNVVTATGNGGELDENDDITFTAVDGSGSVLVVDIQAGQVLAAGINGDASTLAGNLQTVIQNLTLEQTRAASGLTTPTTAATTYNITAGSATINSDNFNTTDDDFGTIGEITLVAGSDTANSISVDITDANGTVTTFSTSDIGVADDVLANGDTITLTGRNAGGDSTGESIVITLATLASSVTLTDADQVADFALALNEFFGVTPAGTVSSSAYTTAGDVDGTNVTAVSVASFDDSTYQTEGFGTVSVAQFTENGTDAENVTFTTTLGDKTYTAALSASANGGGFSAQALTFTATDGSGSAFDVTIAASGTIGTIDTEALADTVATNITAGLADVDIYQVRTINSVDATAVTNTVLEGLASTDVTVTSNQFDTTASSFGDIGSFTGVAGSDTSNSLSVIVNGTTFSATDLGGADDVLSSADGTITLIGRDAIGNDNNERLTIDISGLTGSIDLTNQDEVTALTNALDSYLGSASSTGGLSFQVGSTVTDTISVSISSVSTASIYLDDDGVSTTLSIATQAGATTASSVLDNAINSVIAERANVGSGISRFNFASANLEVSIANQDSARGSFLDADVAKESTTFATQQVKLQASVAVLAQANQLPQSLLSLLQ